MAVKFSSLVFSIVFLISLVSFIGLFSVLFYQNSSLSLNLESNYVYAVEVNSLPITQENTKEKRLNVVTSISPITNIVKNIGGDKINLVGLVPEGVNSHTFELVLSDRIKLRSADLVLIDGLELESGIEKAVMNLKK